MMSNMTTTTAHIAPTSTDERARAMTVAAKAGCDMRTALRALRGGVDVIRPLAVRERVANAIREVEGA